MVSCSPFFSKKTFFSHAFLSQQKEMKPFIMHKRTVFLPNVSEEDGQEDGNGVAAVRLADSGVAQERVTLTGSRGSIVVLVLLVVVKTEDDRDGSQGSKEPQGKVALAVVVDVTDGATIEGVVDLGDSDGLSVQKGRVLLVATTGGTVVVGHVLEGREGDEEGWRGE